MTHMTYMDELYIITIDMPMIDRSTTEEYYDPLLSYIYTQFNVYASLIIAHHSIHALTDN